MALVTYNRHTDKPVGFSGAASGLKEDLDGMMREGAGKKPKKRPQERDRLGYQGTTWNSDLIVRTRSRQLVNVAQTLWQFAGFDDGVAGCAINAQ
jgi:hypothetical protein